MSFILEYFYDVPKDKFHWFVVYMLALSQILKDKVFANTKDYLKISVVYTR